MADDNSQAGISSIFDITVRGDIAGLQQLLSTKDVNIEARDTAGRTALHLAVTAASVDICKCLINHGARLDTWTDQGEAIVHLAAKRGDVAILHTVMEALGTKQQDIQTDNNPDDKGEAKVDSKKDRTVHVNCLTRKYRMSPLYIAVALAHVQVAEALLATYHADANVVVGQDDIQRGTRTVHVLEATLQHPRDVCRLLLRMLLQHGASLLNKSKGDSKSNLLLLAMKRSEDALDIFAELDSENFKYAISRVLWRRSMVCHNALTTAIHHGLENAAFMLLSYGAPPQIDFHSPLDLHSDYNPFGKNTLEAAEDDFWQPILSAAHYEMPKLVIELLDRGADPNARLTDKQIQSLFGRRDCRNVLELVKAKLIELRNWRKEDEKVTYDIKGTPEEPIQLAGKEKAITQLIKDYEEAETKLVSLGAQISDGMNLQRPSSPVPPRPEKKLQLHGPNPTNMHAQMLKASEDASSEKSDSSKLETLEDGHLALFAACRNNNIGLVKALTLKRWGLDSKFPPISISEVSGYSKGPFLAAVESKNYDLARTIIHIATVQRADFAENQTPDVLSAHTLVDDEYTIESLKSISAQVKSHTTAKQIVWESGVCFAAEKRKDVEMLRFAIEIEFSFTPEQRDIDRQMGHAWALVEHGDWPDAFIEYVKATGAPFRHAIAQGKLKAKSQLDRLHQLSPLVKAAWSGNLDMVRFLLDKDRTMAAYKHFAANHDFTTRKAGPEQSRAEFLGVVKKWINNQDNLILHCAVISRNIDLVKFVLSTHPELLEVKSIDGWTPLMVAALHQRIEALHILLEAGASPFATDTYGRNMLHLLLVNPGPGYIPEPEKLSSFLRSMDTSVLHTLLEQRCAESPGGLTPLARWIFVRPEPNAVLTTLLEISTKKPLEMLDGGGHTPLHTITSSSMEKLVGPIAEKAPQVLFHEDAHGKTPFDLAIEKQLHGFIEYLMSSYTRDRRWQSTSPLVHWPLFAFGKDYQGPMQTRDPYKTWEIIQEMIKSMEPQQSPRKLVTQTEWEEIAQLSKDKKLQKNPKGDQHDVVSLAVYKPGNLCW